MINEMNAISKTLKDNSQSIIIMLILLAWDILTKTTAYLFIPFEEEIKIANYFSFTLYYNDTGFGTTLKEFYLSNPIYVVNIIVTILLTGVSIIIVNKTKLEFLIKFIIVFVTFFCLSFISLLLTQYINIRVNNYILLSISIRIAVIYLASILYIYANYKYLKVAIIFWISAILGNLLSSVYPPFTIVDFMYSDIMHNIFGLGIFNMADLYFYPFYMLIILFPFYYLFKKYKSKNKYIRKKVAT